MIIQTKLDDITVGIHCSLKTALQQLENNKYRILFCVDSGFHLVGVLTFGDINRWLLSNKSYSVDVPVFDVCNKNPIKAIEDVNHHRLKELLNEVNYIPIICKDGRLLKFVTHRQNSSGFIIDGFQIGNPHETFIIGEIGNNHNGDINLAKALVEHVASSGAQCVKFQMRDLKSLYANQGNSSDSKENLGSQYTLDLLNKFQLSNDELFEVFDYSKKFNLVPICTPWDLNSVSYLEDYGICAYKIASADLTNHPLLAEVAKTNKPIICSTGMSHEHEIMEAIKLFQNYGSNFALLHCNSTYPVPFKDINLNFIDRLREIGGCEIGYSGHERDIYVSVAAVAKGVSIIERHITTDKGMEGNDHKVSLLPEEFTEMVKAIKQVKEATGSGKIREMSQGEMMNRVTLSKSLFVNCNLNKGEIIEEDMLEVKSPGHGLQPNLIKELVGKKSIRSLKVGDVFYPSDLDHQAPTPREYSFKRRWGLPARHHDYEKLHKLTNLQVLEFHLSYKDLELDNNEHFKELVPCDLVIHAPELFANDHTLDLTARDENYRKQSIIEMSLVIKFALEMKPYFINSNKPLGIITNVGGFSQDGPMSKGEINDCYYRLLESLDELSVAGVEIWPQTMPPFPWHFGGQRYHNLFLDSEFILKFCEETRSRICLDVSHSKLMCNQYHHSFTQFLEEVLPVTSHMHLADAKGIDGEGLQIDEGDIDFYSVGNLIDKYNPFLSWIPEVWQGHENNGEGFWTALERLEEYKTF